MKLSSLALCQDNVCYPSESLKKRSSIESRDGVHKLILQETGNLELICRDDVLWSSNTENSDADRFQFQSDGNLVIRKKDGTFVWESKTVFYGSSSNGRRDKLILQNDGNVVLYKGSQVKWSTRTDRRCPIGKFFKQIFPLIFFI